MAKTYSLQDFSSICFCWRRITALIFILFFLATHLRSAIFIWCVYEESSFCGVLQRFLLEFWYEEVMWASYLSWASPTVVSTVCLTVKPYFSYCSHRQTVSSVCHKLLASCRKKISYLDTVLMPQLPHRFVLKFLIMPNSTRNIICMRCPGWILLSIVRFRPIQEAPHTREQQCAHIQIMHR